MYMAINPKIIRGTTTTPKRIRISMVYSLSALTDKMPTANRITATEVPNTKV